MHRELWWKESAHFDSFWLLLGIATRYSQKSAGCRVHCVVVGICAGVMDGLWLGGNVGMRGEGAKKCNLYHLIKSRIVAAAGGLWGLLIKMDSVE